MRYNDFVDALVLSAPMPKIPKLSACGVAGSAAVAAAGKNLEKQLIEALRMQVGNGDCNGDKHVDNDNCFLPPVLFVLASPCGV